MDLMMIVYAVFVFLITTAIGSFLNVLIYRLPLKISLVKPSSHCPNCKCKIKWYDNIPIISYIILRGKCRNCKEKISIRYLIVELLTGVISTLIFLRFGISLMSLFGILLFLLLIPLSFIDVEHLIIPDSIIIGLLVLGVVGIFFNNINYDGCSITVDYKSKLISLGICIGFGLVVFLFEKLLHKELIGGGDIKLICVAGIILGWQLLLISLGLASIISCIIIIPINKYKSKKNKEKFDPNSTELVQNDESNNSYFPFGPFLSIGIIVSYLFGLNLIDFWMSLIVK